MPSTCIAVRHCLYVASDHDMLWHALTAEPHDLTPCVANVHGAHVHAYAVSSHLEQPSGALRLAVLHVQLACFVASTVVKQVTGKSAVNMHAVNV